jgi:hypothetical protein
MDKAVKSDSREYLVFGEVCATGNQEQVAPK